MKVLILIFTVFLLTGCAIHNQTVAELKTDKNYKGKIKVEKNYQEVYRKLITMSRECLEGAGPAHDIAVSGELYNDIKEAYIQQRMRAGGAFTGNVVIYMGAIYIKAIDDKTTDISVYGHYRAGNIPTPEIEDVRRWVNGDRKCLVQTP
jgi:hypothetical protein